MHWIYVLQCENNYIYVGETTRLYRRFWEHYDGNGGANTLEYTPEKIVAIYKVNTICKFLDYNEYVTNILCGILNENYKSFKLNDFNDEFEYYKYDNLYAENNIAECLMIHKKDEWNNVRGGKYVRFDVEYKYPNNNFIKELPLCKCGYPCDIKKNEENNYLFFRCAKKNMWDIFKKDFEIDEEPCNFFMEYTKDKQLKIQENNIFQERKIKLNELFKKSSWLKNVEINSFNLQCIGGCFKTNENSKLSYKKIKRNLCFDCFIEKNEELKNKYHKVSKNNPFIFD